MMCEMKLRRPVLITSRLLPGVEVGGGWISIRYGGWSDDGRQIYFYHIDLPDGGHVTGNDLKSGVGGGSLQSGLESLLSFLSACGESFNYGSGGENSDLFPTAVAEWAGQNCDELSMLGMELEETPNLIEE